ncbi:MAG TPA: GNAT family N-acetyltransferase [Acidimicrobiales bacterium]
MSAIDIRPIAEGDWPAVVALFRAVVAEGDTYAYPDGLSSDEAHELWVESPPGHTVVALRDGVLVATAKYGPNRPGRGAHISTASFMVSVEWRGTGVGRALCDYVLARSREAGYAGMQFNAVVSTNTNAIALYRTLGFVTIGTVPGAFDHAQLGPVGLDIMFLEF